MSFRFSALLIAGVLFTGEQVVGQNVLAVKGGKVITMAGEPIEAGIVLIKEGKIAAVGKDVAIPTEARVLDATGKIVMPGMVDVHSPRGIEQANERNANVANLSIVDALDPSMEYFEECRRNGVTTVAAVPGNETTFGSQAAIIKTAGAYVDDMIVKRDFAIKISLSPSTGRNRMSQIATIRAELDAVAEEMRAERESEAQKAGKKGAPEKKATEEKKTETEQPDQKKSDTAAPQTSTPAATSAQREVLKKALKGEIKVYVHCEEAMDVPQALRLIDRYRLKAILCLGEKCYKAVKLVAEKKLPVVLDPTLTFWETDPRSGEDRFVVLPKVYGDAKVPYCFQTTGFAGGSLFRAASLPPTVGTNYLWFQAATAVKHGLPKQQALETITIQPARWLGVDSVVGSLEPGKDADLAILTGDPLKFDTWVETTIINGAVVYERAKDSRLQQMLNPKKN